MPGRDEASQAAYEDLVRLARRFVRREHDARDLAQDALLAALDRGFVDWAAPGRRAWLRGVLRRRSAFLRRTESRRTRREQTATLQAESRPGPPTWHPDFIASLPASLRAVATLVGADLSAAEVRWLLRLTPTAWRSRLAALRRALRADDSPSLSVSNWTKPPPYALGARRAVLLAGLKTTGLPMFAAHDPDGHAIFLP